MAIQTHHGPHLLLRRPGSRHANSTTACHLDTQVWCIVCRQERGVGWVHFEIHYTLVTPKWTFLNAGNFRKYNSIMNVLFGKVALHTIDSK